MSRGREKKTKGARRFVRFLRVSRGTESLEWGLVGGLLVAVAIVLLVLIRPKVSSMWNDTNEEIPATASGGGSGGGSGSSGGGSGSGGSGGGTSQGGDDPEALGNGK